MGKPYVWKRNNSRFGIILHTCKYIMCQFQLKTRRQSPNCYLEYDTRFTKSGSHMWTHIWKLKSPHSILFSLWYIHKMDSTSLSLVKPLVVKNIPRRLLVSKQEFIWQPLTPMPAARTSNQIVKFNSLISTNIWETELTDSNKIIFPVCFCMKVIRTI